MRAFYSLEFFKLILTDDCGGIFSKIGMPFWQVTELEGIFVRSVFFSDFYYDVTLRKPGEIAERV